MAVATPGMDADAIVVGAGISGLCCARALQAAVLALKARGKAEVGNKTMLDVLAPVAAHLETGSATFDSIRALAADSARATIPMKAIRGRASFLGERSIGHMDPGARSSEIMITAVPGLSSRISRKSSSPSFPGKYTSNNTTAGCSSRTRSSPSSTSDSLKSGLASSW